MTRPFSSAHEFAQPVRGHVRRCCDVLGRVRIVTRNGAWRASPHANASNRFRVVLITRDCTGRCHIGAGALATDALAEAHRGLLVLTALEHEQTGPGAGLAPEFARGLAELVSAESDAATLRHFVVKEGLGRRSFEAALTRLAIAERFWPLELDPYVLAEDLRGALEPHVVGERFVLGFFGGITAEVLRLDGEAYDVVIFDHNRERRWVEAIVPARVARSAIVQAAAAALMLDRNRDPAVLRDAIDTTLNDPGGSSTESLWRATEALAPGTAPEPSDARRGDADWAEASVLTSANAACVDESVDVGQVVYLLSEISRAVRGDPDRSAFAFARGLIEIYAFGERHVVLGAGIGVHRRLVTADVVVDRWTAQELVRAVGIASSERSGAERASERVAYELLARR